jgi:hypothetical protein
VAKMNKRIYISNSNINFRFDDGIIEVNQPGMTPKYLKVDEIADIRFRPGDSIEDPTTYIIELERQPNIHLKDLGKNSGIAGTLISKMRGYLELMFRSNQP